MSERLAHGPRARGGALLLLWLALLLAVSGAHGQETDAGLAVWDIALWPEYDRPAVLVIYSMSYPEGTALPRETEVMLPSDATVNAVAYVGENGGLFTLPWQSESSPDGQRITFDAETLSVVVEYYVDAISPPPDRDFSLALPAPYAVADSTLTLRMPSRATDLVVNPALAEAGVDAQGNALYSTSLGPLEADQEVPVSVTYTKPDAEPTVGEQVEITPMGGSLSAQAEDPLPDWALVLLGLLVGALIIGVAVLGMRSWQARRASGQSRQARRRQARRNQAGTAVQPARQPGSAGSGRPGAKDRFCSRCGAAFADDDRFCRACGTPRR